MTTKKLTLIAISIFGSAVIVVVLYMWLNKFRISETGTLGDGFNGLLAPFISFAGALLVYLSFREQIKANQLISSQWTLDMYLRILDDLTKDFEKLRITIFSVGDKKGKEAFEALSQIEPKQVSNSGVYREVSNVFASILYLNGKLKSEPIEKQEFIYRKLQQFYEMNIKDTLLTLIGRLDEEINPHIKFLVGQARKINSEIYHFKIS